MELAIFIYVRGLLYGVQENMCKRPGLYLLPNKSWLCLKKKSTLYHSAYNQTLQPSIMVMEMTSFWCRWGRERAKEPDTCLISNCEFSCVGEHCESSPGVCPAGA